jgi:hypothetical protein
VDAGYTISAGWGVMVCPPAVHLNPEIYEDPLAFNPWRWQVCALFSLCKLEIKFIHISHMILNIRIPEEYKIQLFIAIHAYQTMIILPEVKRLDVHIKLHRNFSKLASCYK